MIVNSVRINLFTGSLFFRKVHSTFLLFFFPLFYSPLFCLKSNQCMDRFDLEAKQTSNDF